METFQSHQTCQVSQGSQGSGYTASVGRSSRVNQRYKFDEHYKFLQVPKCDDGSGGTYETTEDSEGSNYDEPKCRRDVKDQRGPSAVPGTTGQDKKTHAARPKSASNEDSSELLK
jgi:hypothetical protein